MAQHVHDSLIYDRRLRPIYELLELGNNKKALQEAEKLLKKMPVLPCGRALKALALLRLGREEESNTLLKALAEEKPSDEATLQVLSFCYKETEQLEKICELYKEALKKSPGNDELLAHLFMSYVRLDDFKSQQTVALQLYRQVRGNPYYFWAVNSVVLQGLRGPESSVPAKRSLFLALAQRMVEEFISQEKIKDEQEVQLYLSILMEQGKFKEALDFLGGTLCQKVYPGAHKSLKIDLFKKLNMWNELNSYLKMNLRSERDRWDYYKDYLTSCFELAKLNDTTEENENNILDNCHEFLCQLIEGGKRVRGPYLARLELHKRMRENNMNAKELLGDFADLIIEYFRFFGDKQCCTNDIALFLESISRDERITVASKLVRDSGISSTTLPQNKEQMQKHICSLQLSRMCGSNIGLSQEHLLALYTALRLHYEHGLSAFGQNLLSTDMGPSDPYSLLATHIMYDVAAEEGKSYHLIEAICLLYYVLQNSPSNFHAKLLLLKIYHFLGCGVGAHQIYESLDIKHIQLESMGYLHCALLPATGLVSVAKSVYDVTLSFFTTSYKERLEYIAMAYKYGSFSKIEEFMDFRDRLSNSLHYASTSAEQLLLELVCLSGALWQNLNTYKMMSIHPAEDRIKWNELADNRDLSVVVRWDPIDLIDHNEKQNSFDQDIECLQIRSHLLRLVASFIDALNSHDKIQAENSNEGNRNTEVLESLKTSWNEIFKRIRSKNFTKSSNKFLVNLLPSRLHAMLDMPYETFFSDVAEFLIDLSINFQLTDDRVAQLNGNVSKVQTILCDSVRENNDQEDNIWNRREIQQRIVSAVEILSLYAFVLSVCHQKYATTPVQAKKSKKKEGVQKTASENLSQRIIGLMRHLKQELQICDNELVLWKQPKFHTSLAECMSGMSLNPQVESSVTTKVSDIFKENHLQTIKDLRNIIKDKIRMVNK
ncbi:unnamed protein product [Hermetia illucens]|uniref:N-terminal acetyltransferase B complex subunit MDM20 homolog n=1 Tax=Hermetia illucens TaxID=343691 RepID=A0A7R8Z1A7_HERIL|nr:phagocyte signaling-impaired protein [Hermetia illucens]CAD7093319.1 unnamed protein product [Hermetia illucens]